MREVFRNNSLTIYVKYCDPDTERITVVAQSYMDKCPRFEFVCDETKGYYTNFLKLITDNKETVTIDLVTYWLTNHPETSAVLAYGIVDAKPLVREVFRNSQFVVAVLDGRNKDQRTKVLAVLQRVAPYVRYTYDLPLSEESLPFVETTTIDQAVEFFSSKGLKPMLTYGIRHKRDLWSEFITL